MDFKFCTDLSFKEVFNIDSTLKIGLNDWKFYFRKSDAVKILKEMGNDLPASENIDLTVPIEDEASVFEENGIAEFYLNEHGLNYLFMNNGIKRYGELMYFIYLFGARNLLGICFEESDGEDFIGLFDSFFYNYAEALSRINATDTICEFKEETINELLEEINGLEETLDEYSALVETLLKTNPNVLN